MSTSELQTAEGQEESLDIKLWLFKIVRMWPWFLFSLAVCLMVSFLYLRYTEPVYKAVASIMIKDEKKRGCGDDG